MTDELEIETLRYDGPAGWCTEQTLWCGSEAVGHVAIPDAGCDATVWLFERSAIPVPDAAAGLRLVRAAHAVAQSGGDYATMLSAIQALKEAE